jgi:hypothetical protein
MSIQVESTTDSKEQVLAAIGGAKSTASKDNNQSVSSNDDKSSPDESVQEESETSEENLDDTNDDSDSSVSDDDEEIKDDLKEDQKPKKRSGFQRRIDKFQKKISEKDQEIEHWKKAAMSGAGKPLEQAKTESKQENIADVTGKPDPSQFDSHRDYVEALTDWKIDNREKSKEMKAKETQIKTEYQAQISTFQSKVAEFSKSTADFNDVIADVDDIPLSHSVQEAILTSDFGPQLMYELSKNRAEYQRINSMSPTAASREIGKIEARLGLGQDTNKTREARITKTPAPIDPVGSKSSGKIFKSPDEMTLTEYKAFRKTK